MTERGRVFRQGIEDRTDVLAFPAYAVLDDGECERLAELARVFGRAVVGAGLLSFG
ncbi:helix-turn-helix domain-containing protein [Acrocarpospora pleiomorpha]|uniref:helix-turn-helix domain-containing protein n=1 Tax=Acrocarpospora pleiomorpha TaxID=90975 RepID=UPI0035A259A9